jgi:hypothetical protein
VALIHRATLTPSKLDLLRAWLPTRPWFPSGAEVESLGAYRFDDPAGEVGVETFLLRAGDAVLQVPLTYRSAPPDVDDAHRLGTTEHSVLGTRWVTDGCADPVWAQALLHAVLTGGDQATEEVDVDGVLQPREPSATVRGSGAPGAAVPPVTGVRVHDDATVTTVDAGAASIVLARVVGTDLDGTHRLDGTWSTGSATLATVHPTEERP